MLHYLISKGLIVPSAGNVFSVLPDFLILNFESY